MFHKGLDRQQITEAAKELIEEYGYDQFSMRQLADRLGIKTASLYAHVTGMEALLTDVGLLALREQRDCQFAAIAGKHREEAVTCLALAYRSYAKRHAGLYRFIMRMPVGTEEALREAASMVTEPVMQVLNDYALTETQKLHWQRVLRGVMHGFLSEEESGYFSHYPVDVEESYAIAVRCLLSGLSAEEANGVERG